MSTSYNGWALRSSFPARRPGPSITGGFMRGFANDDVADVFAYLMWQWHARIEPVRLWGGGRTIAYNASVGGHPQSCHVSGTATDTNWDDHPFEKRDPANYNDGFTGTEERELRKINAEIVDDGRREVIRLGIDFDVEGTRLYEDAMHAEIGRTGNGNVRLYVSPAQVAQAASRIRKTFVPPRDYDDIRTWQRRVGVTADGSAGTGTLAATRRLQKAYGVPQTGLWDVPTNDAYQKVSRAASDLKTLGYAATPQGVADYQADAGLKADAIAGPTTLKSLGETVSKIDEVLKNQEYQKKWDRYAYNRLIALQESIDKLTDSIRGLPNNVALTVWRFKNRNITDRDAYFFVRNGQVDNEDRDEYPAQEGSLSAKVDELLGKETDA